MIQEGLLLAQLAPTPLQVQGQALAGSNGVDLNPDHGLGEQPPSGPGRPPALLRKAQMPGQTGELMIRVDVTTDFVEVVGTPADQPTMAFHAAMSSTAGSITLASNEFVIIGSNVGPPELELVGGRTAFGYLASDLTVGTSIFIRLDPWSAVMGRGVGGSSLPAEDLRFIGLVQQVTTAAGGTESYFSAGQVIGRFVLQSDVGFDPTDFIYPSAVEIVG